MKKILLTFTISLLAASAAFAQQHVVDVRDVSVKMTRDGQVEVSFTVKAGKRAVKGNQTLMLTPRIAPQSGEAAGGVNLIPVIIQGARARISDLREEMSYRTPTRASQAVNVKRGSGIFYRQTVEYGEWMDGAVLYLDRNMYGLRSLTTDTEVLLRRIELGERPELPEPPVQEPTVTKPAVPERPAGESTADKLASDFSFVSPIPAKGKERSDREYTQMFDYNMPLVGVDGAPAEETQTFTGSNRDKLLQLRFTPGGASLQRHYRDNNKALVDLVSVIRAIEESSDSRVERIVVAGFSSPEGAGPLNIRLTDSRVQDVKEFILNNTNVRGTAISVHSEGMDWYGLRRMVATSSMPSREVVLNIIDSVPVWDYVRKYGRMGELMRLRGGDPYRYMYRNFFPELCDAVYVKVYYSNK